MCCSWHSPPTLPANSSRWTVTSAARLVSRAGRLMRRGHWARTLKGNGRRRGHHVSGLRTTRSRGPAFGPRGIPRALAAQQPAVVLRRGGPRPRLRDPRGPRAVHGPDRPGRPGDGDRLRGRPVQRADRRAQPRLPARRRPAAGDREPGLPGPCGLRRPRPGDLRRGADGGCDGPSAHAPRAVRGRAGPRGVARRPAGTRTGRGRRPPGGRRPGTTGPARGSGAHRRERAPRRPRAHRRDHEVRRSGRSPGRGVPVPPGLRPAGRP